jgi:hypothetical protein
MLAYCHQGRVTGASSIAEACRLHLATILEGTNRDDPVVIDRATRYFERVCVEKVSGSLALAESVAHGYLLRLSVQTRIAVCDCRPCRLSELASTEHRPRQAPHTSVWCICPLRFWQHISHQFSDTVASFFNSSLRSIEEIILSVTKRGSRAQVRCSRTDPENHRLCVARSSFSEIWLGRRTCARISDPGLRTTNFTSVR